MNCLIVGGTSGLGLEMAREMAGKDAKVIVTGRHDPKIDFADYRELDLSSDNLPRKIDSFVKNLPTINVLVYAAGYFQEGLVTDLTDKQIEEMIDVCGRGLIYFVKDLLEKQGQLDELITITSTSAWTPRKLEPIYNFAKAGAGHFTNAMAEDGRVKKVIQAGPAGMETNFWKGTGHDTSTMNKPAWVAKQIMEARNDNFRYRFVKILREPSRVEEVEKR